MIIKNLEKKLAGKIPVTESELRFLAENHETYDLTKLDVSKVTDMRDMFACAYAFNQDISNWDVSKVTDMRDMFYSAKSFNQDISSWNVSNVTDMAYMFRYTYSFDLSCIENWEVQPIDFIGMPYQMTISKNHLRIGCKYYTHAEWLALTIDEAIEMDSYGEHIYTKFREPIRGLIQEWQKK